MKDWNEVVLVPEFNEQGVACYRLDGGDYLNEYYIVSEAESRKLLNVPEVVGYEVYDCLIPSTSQMLYYLKEQKKVTSASYPVSVCLRKMRLQDGRSNTASLRWFLTAL